MLYVNLRTKAGGVLNPMVTLNTRNIDETDTMRITWIMRVAAGSDIVIPIESTPTMSLSLLVTADRTLLSLQCLIFSLKVTDPT